MKNPETNERIKSRRRIGLPAAVAGIAVLAASPAVAAVIMKNYVRADITKVAACMVKVEGPDAVTYATAAQAPYVDVNTTSTLTTSDGVSLLNETFTVKSFKGDRLFVTDGMRIRNTCNYAIVVGLKAEADAASTAGAATSGDWLDTDVKIYLAKSSIGTVLGTATSGTDFSVAADWDQAPIHITPSATGTVANSTTGTMSIPAGSEIQVGMKVDAGTTAGTVTAATLRFTVTGTAA